VYNTRYITLSFIAFAVVFGLVARSASVDVLLWVGKADTMVAGMMPMSDVIGLSTGVLSFFGALKWRKAVTYTDEVIAELVKVTWPDREETTNNSMVVIVASLIFAGSLAIFDYVWAQITEIFLFST
jgi:preprotein translocase SecE subunit